MRVVVIRADYDADAKVWFVKHSDLFGVHVEGTTLDELRDKLPAVVRDLIEADGAAVTQDVLIEIIAHTSARLAA